MFNVRVHAVTPSLYRVLCNTICRQSRTTVRYASIRYPDPRCRSGPREEGIKLRVYRFVLVHLCRGQWPDRRVRAALLRTGVQLFRRRTRSLHAEACRWRGFRARCPAGDEVLDRCAAMLAGPLRLALAEVAPPGLQARPLPAVGVAAAPPTAVLGHAALEAKAATDGTRGGEEGGRACGCMRVYM